MDFWQQAAAWFMSPAGRLISAAIIFMMIWGIKNIPWIKKNVLTTDRRKLFANAILAMAPAAAMLIDPTVEAREAWYDALMIFLSSMGIQGGLKAAAGNAAKSVLRIGERKEDK